MLVARDEQSCLVVSYKDIKTCISNAFECVFFSWEILVDRVLTTTLKRSGSCYDGESGWERTSCDLKSDLRRLTMSE